MIILIMVRLREKFRKLVCVGSKVKNDGEGCMIVVIWYVESVLLIL